MKGVDGMGMTGDQMESQRGWSVYEPGGRDSGWGTCLDELSASSSPKINFIGLSENGLFECR